MPAATALRMATANGARALGGNFGSLAVGMAADFIAVEVDELAPETGPVYSIVSHLVYATGRHQVTDVWVAGAQLLAGRALTTIDEAALRSEMRAWRDKVRPQEEAKA